MKKWLLVFGSLIILSGCSMETVLDKVPFLQKDEEKVKEETNSSTRKQEKTEEAKKDNEKQSETGSAKEQLSLEASYFNVIAQVKGKNIIQNPENILLLVNKNFGLPDGYIPADLVRPNVDFSFGDQDIEKSYMRKEAAAALETMFKEAANNGFQLMAVSGYRSFERQTEVFNAEVNRVGQEQAVQAVAIPGNSEHQTGLAMDISSVSANLELSEKFGEMPEGKWLVENAHRFGFVLRYPNGKEGVTGYRYESWHFRYVGVKAATEIYENQLTLEEYFDIVKKI